MSPADYDAWYRTPRGRWIGETEYRLLREVLVPPAGASVLDVGCGTGYFTRRLASNGLDVTGVDPSAEMILFARSQSAHGARYTVGDARRLPFPDRQFDCCVAITSLCFIREQDQAVAEMVRVTRRRIALGLLNRHSLLHWQKGRRGGQGAYRGAAWHSARDARQILDRFSLRCIRVRSAIYLPSGSAVAKCIECAVPHGLFFGGFLLVVGDVT
jgi:SAM-dependent methyltransferase